jgi:hypothetical protein
VVQLAVNGVVKSAKTNSSGVWKVNSLSADTYTATVNLTGYQPASVTAATLGGQTMLVVTTLAL